MKFKNREALETWIRDQFDGLWITEMVEAYADILEKRALALGLRYGKDWCKAIAGESQFREDFDVAYAVAYPREQSGGWHPTRKGHAWAVPGKHLIDNGLVDPTRAGSVWRHNGTGNPTPADRDDLS